MEINNSSSLILSDTAKQVWDYVHHIYPEYHNITLTFDIKKTFYSPENGDCSLETYYLEMTNAHHKLAMLQPLSSDIKVMEKIRNQMNGNMFLIWIAS